LFAKKKKREKEKVVPLTCYTYTLYEVTDGLPFIFYFQLYFSGILDVQLRITWDKNFRTSASGIRVRWCSSVLANFRATN
jgi:hypothetical protein